MLVMSAIIGSEKTVDTLQNSQRAAGGYYTEVQYTNQSRPLLITASGKRLCISGE